MLTRTNSISDGFPSYIYCNFIVNLKKIGVNFQDTQTVNLWVKSSSVVFIFLCRRSTNALHSDSSESCASEKDPLSQRFSVAVHPHLPVILSSDGYLVTVMQLPPVASYHGIMTGFMRDVTRCVLHFKSGFIWLWTDDFLSGGNRADWTVQC